MRTERVIKNFITDFLPQILIIVIGIFKSKVLLQYLGSDSLGLYQLFAQFIAYLALAEGGLASAATSRLYKSVAKEDNEKTVQIMNATKKCFYIVSAIIMGGGIIISFFVPFFIQDNPFSNTYVITHFLMYVLSEIFIYLSVYIKVLFDAKQEKYKINIIAQSSLILKGILEICLLLLGGNLTALLSMFIVLNAITNLFIILYGKKNFKNLPKTKKADFDLVKDIKNLFIHKIAGLISGNIDVIIISKMIGLGYVVVYTTYNYIVNGLKILVEKIYGSVLAGIGNLITLDIKKSRDFFFEYNSLMFFLATVISVPLLYAVDIFIKIFYEGEILTSLTISIPVIILFIYNTIRIPLTSYCVSAGKFKETNKCAIIEAVINLTLSLVLVNFWGIAGVLWATVIAYLVSEYFIKPKIIFNQILLTGAREYYLRNFKLLSFLAIDVVLVVLLRYIFTAQSMLMMALVTAIIFVINTLITYFYYKMTKEDMFMDRLMGIFKKKTQN